MAGVIANLTAGYLSDHLGRSRVVWPALILMSVGTAVLRFLPVSPLIIIISSSLAGLGFAGGLITLMAWIAEG
ncbi:major facilitator superfamily protein [Calderihabitans maritimus]|uniref:Major facilitator superfamily protein n=1 Tax=Calderihabitans maritimus TaxID=1246530 RepID=A0A1Z5HWQ3_9FIRM|nr:major facilitator superfamily protein [Calderihabitans maritimus]